MQLMAAAEEHLSVNHAQDGDKYACRFSLTLNNKSSSHGIYGLRLVLRTNYHNSRNTIKGLLFVKDMRYVIR